MRVLLDVNVLLDHLLERAPWAAEAAAIWQSVDERRLAGFVAATTLTNIFYAAPIPVLSPAEVLQQLG